MTTGRPLIGAFHAPAWAGLVVSDEPGQGAAFRFLVSRRGDRADWTDMTNIISEVGPAAADGSYARLGFDTTRDFTRGPSIVPDGPGSQSNFVVEWSRLADDRLVGRVSADYQGVCELRGYFPWNWTGSWAIDRSDLVGQWGPRPSTVMVRAVHRPAIRRSERGRAILDGSGDAGVRFDLDLGSRIYLDCTLVDGEPDPVRPAPDLEEIDRVISEARTAYEDERMMVSGQWAGLGQSVTSTAHWGVLLQPETGELYSPAGREWVFPDPSGNQEPWMTFGWDSFLNAMALELETPALAESTIRTALETQYPDGNVPNWRAATGGTPDRSQPPIGSYAVLKHYLRTGNRDLLEWANPALQRWNAWWYEPKGPARRRDGNGNGLFNWGCDVELISTDAPPWEQGHPDIMHAMWESGQADLPHWEEATWSSEAGTMELDAVDLNSYLALDFECLARIASAMGDSDREMWYLEQYRALRKRMNDLLWDDETGIYRDRRWDGQLSHHLGAVNFLPLVAGIPSPEQAERMVEVLLDSSEFWGAHVIPTVSRHNVRYKPDGDWHGAIRGVTNYLIYQGLRRYHLDQVAAHLARLSVDMYLGAWRKHHATHEQFNSQSGAPSGKQHHGSGTLFALLGIEEFIDITPWEGLRIGTLAVNDHSTLHRCSMFGQQWSVHLAGDGLVVAANGVNILRTSAPAVIREIVFEEAGLSGHISTLTSLSLSVESMEGPCIASIDGVEQHLAQPVVPIPAGNHQVNVRTA